ncbi:MAG: hypothetical protein H6849_01770 [Alphaproteobacteria bacterium]|nr:MAG: hypothetical protein H6849_01770 [Alphaproteobacteria bacterium]
MKQFLPYFLLPVAVSVSVSVTFIEASDPSHDPLNDSHTTGQTHTQSLRVRRVKPLSPRNGPESPRPSFTGIFGRLFGEITPPRHKASIPTTMRKDADLFGAEDAIQKNIPEGFSPDLRPGIERPSEEEKKENPLTIRCRPPFAPFVPGEEMLDVWSRWERCLDKSQEPLL